MRILGQSVLNAEGDILHVFFFFLREKSVDWFKCTTLLLSHRKYCA